MHDHTFSLNARLPESPSTIELIFRAKFAILESFLFSRSSSSQLMNLLDASSLSIIFTESFDLLFVQNNYVY